MQTSSFVHIQKLTVLKLHRLNFEMGRIRLKTQRRTLNFTTAIAVPLMVILFGYVLMRMVATIDPARTHAITNVEVKLIDTATGRTTPAMVCITNVDDGTIRLPPDGRVCANEVTLQDYGIEEFLKGIQFEPDRNWIGPIRRTLGNGRDYVYESRPSLPYWKEPVMYQTSGNFSIELPEGRWRIAVAHGMEYVPVVEEFRTHGDGSFDKTIGLERWIDLPRRGWYSGDVHVHHPSLTEAHREYLLHYAMAEDLHVANLLEMSHHEKLPQGTEFKQKGFGKKFRTNRGDYWLVSGQEGPRSTFGHIIGLNIDHLVHDVDSYDFYDLAFRELHSKEEAVVGYAHFAYMGTWDKEISRGFPWYIITKEVDFVELLQIGLINPSDYHDYLNLGFKLTAAAGSDVPYTSTLGEVRTFVYTGSSPLDIDLWFANLKKGHTFVSNGPALEFTVDGKIPGSEIEIEAGTTAKVVAKVLGHPKVGLPVSLTVTGNDGVLKEITSERKQEKLFFELELPIEKSQWLVASAVCDNDAVAHTSPIYIIVDGRSYWCSKRGPRLIEKQLNIINAIEKEFIGQTDARSRGIIERLQKAKNFYAELEDEMERWRRISASQ